MYVEISSTCSVELEVGPTQPQNLGLTLHADSVSMPEDKTVMLSLAIPAIAITNVTVNCGTS